MDGVRKNSLTSSKYINFLNPLISWLTKTKNKSMFGP